MSTGENLMYEWNTLPWPKLERIVFKLQKRIYQASKRNDKVAVHRLQRLLMNSAAAKYIAVRRVTQTNRGKHTAGVDGVKSLTPDQKLKLAHNLSWGRRAEPVRRVWIPKPGKTEKRPLGIPIMRERAMQALVKLAMEPEWEAKFEPNSYGFRPGRSCHDAIEAVRLGIRQTPKYVLDADIAGCFDNINHVALLQKTATFPRVRRQLKLWLKAGVMDGEKFISSEAGTPQGGVISPLLANIALHGLETELEQAYPKYKQIGGVRISWRPSVVRYADDFVVMHPDPGVIEECRITAQRWLAGIGLELKPSKTRIAHTLRAFGDRPGFDFLGCAFRQFLVGKFAPRGQKRLRTIIQPSKKAVQSHYEKLQDVISTLKSNDQDTVIRELNPIIRGWTNYYRPTNSRETFHKMRFLLFKRLWSWATRRHGHKSANWVKNKYFNQGRPWLFKSHRGSALLDYDQVTIQPHIKVLGNASPFDGNWDYWATKRKHHPELPKAHSVLLRRQNGRCAHCNHFFEPNAVLRCHHLDGNPQNLAYGNRELVHAYCLQSIRSAPRAPTHRGAV